MAAVLGIRRRRRLDEVDPRFGDDPLAAPHTSIEIQQAEARHVARSHVGTDVAQVPARSIARRCVRLDADGIEQPGLDVGIASRDRTCRCVDQTSQKSRCSRAVLPFGVRLFLERLGSDVGSGIGGGDQTIEVVRAVATQFVPLEPRRHVEQVAKRDHTPRIGRVGPCSDRRRGVETQ